MPEKRRRYFLKNKEAKTLLQKASEELHTDLTTFFKQEPEIEVLQTDSDKIYLIDRKPVLLESGKNIHPTLKFDQYINSAPKIVVDMGAVPHVCKGADIMAPGVRRIEGRFQPGTIVAIVDEKHGKPIALGETIYGSEESGRTTQGTLVKNLHYVGDKTWSLLKELTSNPHQEES